MPFTALLDSIALAELGFLGRIGQSKFERLLLVLRHRTVPVALTYVTFHISKDKYTSLITDSVNQLLYT